ncbi:MULTISPECIES: hypothetical protein [unclassified Burkholderia]|uniref:hypothetical protein n=1 Tax=unclassified Burkholderia TaxID=2613784 RepID=UPI000A44E45C|nr:MULTISPECIES: hypothetical protein [unclassified Burkholderia]
MEVSSFNPKKHLHRRPAPILVFDKKSLDDSPAALVYSPAPIKRAMHRMRGGLHVLARKCR